MVEIMLSESVRNWLRRPTSHIIIM